MNKKRLFGYLFVLVSVGNISAQESRLSAQEYKLWYDRPAQVWTEALPLGNGRLGAMVYGTPATEQIQLNEETIWAGRPNNNANPNALEYIPRVRDLVFAGKYLEAQTLATEKVMAKSNSGMPYQSFGDLRIAFPGHTRYTNYYRELSLDSARTLVRYAVDGVQYRRETITSFTDQVIMVRLTANRPGRITFNAQLTSSGCRRHFRRGKLRNTFRRIFPARRTERQSGVSGKTDRPEHWRSDGMCRRCAFSRRSR